jgi:hypothetical protein
VLTGTATRCLKRMHEQQKQHDGFHKGWVQYKGAYAGEYKKAYIRQMQDDERGGTGDRGMWVVGAKCGRAFTRDAG